jgi:hypothetical protein
MNAGPGGSEPSESDKAAEAALEAAIRRTGYASSPAAPKPVDHYAILGLAHDFTPAELKRRYKKASLAAHPDRAGGSLSLSLCLSLSLSLSLTRTAQVAPPRRLRRWPQRTRCSATRRSVPPVRSPLTDSASAVPFVAPLLSRTDGDAFPSVCVCVCVSVSVSVCLCADDIGDDIPREVQQHDGQVRLTMILWSH